MPKKQNRRSKKGRSKWPLIGAAVGVFAGILWNDKRQETREVQACGIIMAESTIPDAGWGIYTLKVLPKDSVVPHPEVTIQMPDIRTEQQDDLSVLIEKFLWNAHRYVSEQRECRVFLSEYF